MEKISMGFAQNDWLRQVRGWKLFLVLPRLLLHQPPRGKVGREKLVSRFLKFSAGQWANLFRASQECSEQAATISRRKSDAVGAVWRVVLRETSVRRCRSGARI